MLLFITNSMIKLDLGSLKLIEDMTKIFSISKIGTRPSDVKKDGDRITVNQTLEDSSLMAKYERLMEFLLDKK